MISQTNASVTGRQKTLADSWKIGNNESRPSLSQRQKKRLKKTSTPLFIEGQSSLSINAAGSWNLRQCQQENKVKQSREYWGDKLGLKDVDMLRVVSKNIQGLGLQAGNPKEDELKSWIVNKNIDLIGIQEINVNWNKCNNKNRFSERIRNPAWEFARYSVAFNKHDKKYRHQYGGCISLGVEQVTHRISGSGADERGLGRWSWLLLKGKDKVLVRVVTVYQPNLNKLSTQCGSVYSQQRAQLLQNNIDKCPLEIFRSDLIQQLKTWIKMKNKIIIMIDANEDVRKGPLSKAFENLGLISAIRTKHGEFCPATQHKGSDPIDDIFISPGIKVKKSGFLPFGDGPGDHRAVYADLCQQSLFGGEFHKIHRLPARRLISTNERVVEKFNQLFNNKLKEHNVHQRMEILRLRSHRLFTEDDAVEYEKLDNIQQNAYVYAEKRCRKLKAGEVCYEPKKIQHYGILIRLSTLIIRKQCECKVSTRLIERLAKKTNTKDPFSMSVDEAKELRKVARKEYMRNKPNSRELRSRWLGRLADSISKKYGEDKAKILRRIRQREDLRDAHRKIKWARNKGVSTGTDRVTITDDDGQTREITEKEDIERILMGTNKSKFTQANDTPFNQQPLKDIVGPRGLTKESDDILLGNFVPPQGIHQGAIDFLTAVKMDPDVVQGGPISADISADQHCEYWRKAREATQSSISGLHFGFYKASSRCKEIAQTVSGFLRIPFCTGYSPKRFRKSLNVSIMKEANNYKPEKQRTIHLLEANFSEGAKIIFSRRMLGNARKYNLIPEEQYARKGGKAIDAVLHKVLVFDYLRMMRRPGIVFASDLMNNYDRMSHSVGSLAMRALGVPMSAIKCLTTSIQDMQHHIRTAYGDSDSYYSGSTENPLQGGGQGNPASPPMWTAITIIIVRILAMYTPGVNIMSSISLLTIVFTAILYVDDTDLFIVGKSSSETPADVLKRAHEVVKIWDQSIWATGGVLRPEKCHWYFIAFSWLGSKWSYMSKAELDGEIKVNNQHLEEEVVKRHDPHTAECTLGVYVAVDGNMVEQKKQLGLSTNSWVQQITSSFLFRSEILLALVTTISRTWMYPLQATTFSSDDCDDIVRPLYAEILPRLGANRKIPKVYRYAPKSLMGLGLPDIYVMQGTAQIKAILFHMNKGTMVGKLLMAELEAASIELGRNCSIFELQYKNWNHLLTDCWLKPTWEFRSNNNIQLQGRCPFPSLQRQHDSCIMQALVEKYSDKFTKGEMCSINRCRLHLQVLFLSDIVNGQGNRVTSKAINGIRDSHRRSQWIWPFQPRPSRKEWAIWRRAVTVVVSGGESLSQNLRFPLGAWVSKPHQKFSWFFSPSENAVYNRLRVGWRKYYKIDRNRTSMDRLCFHRGRRVIQTPDDLCQTGIQMGPNANCVWIDGHSTMIEDNEQAQNIHWFHAAALQHSQATYELVKNTFFYSNDQHILHLLQSGEWTIVTDGSYSPNKKKGTAAIIIESASGTPLIKSYVLTPGVADDVNAYRSELIGIYVGCLILKLFREKCETGGQKVIFGCDNEKAVYLGLQSRQFSPVMTKHVDILWEIQSICRSLDIDIEALHVRGHQSQLQCEQSQLARMNAEADGLAKRYLSFCIMNPEVNISQDLGGCHWSVWCGNKKLVKDIDGRITRHIHGTKLRLHVAAKKGWRLEDLDIVDWDALECVSKSDTSGDTLWKMKVASGFVPVATRMVMTKQWDSNVCPRCQCDVENVEHLLVCNHNGAKTIRDSHIQSMLVTLQERDTDPCIVSTVINTLCSTTSGRFQDHVPPEANHWVRLAAQEQDRLGRFSIFQGYISKTWTCAQEEYWESLSTSKRRSIRQWSCCFLRLWLKFLRDQWDHRNDHVHNKNKEDKKKKYEKEVNQKVNQAFQLGLIDLRPSDVYLISDTSLEAVQKLDIKRKAQWVDQVDTARKKIKLIETTEMSRMRRFMQNWRSR